MMIDVKSRETVSAQIRRRRMELGLSLKELAMRIDTSAATMSRYESGWNRFELRTVEKIAGALDCDLQVRLVPQGAPSSAPTPRAVTRRLGRLFWDRALCAGDLTSHAQWVLERVVEYGNLEDVKTLIAFLGRDAFLDGVSRANLGSRRTASFWTQILAKEGRPCTRKYSRATAWNC